MNATSKLVKAWESKNAKNAAKAGGISMMALSLAACGGSSTRQRLRLQRHHNYRLLLNLCNDCWYRYNNRHSCCRHNQRWFECKLNTNACRAWTRVDGGAGTDTMNIVFNTAGTYAPTILNVETINLTTSAAITVDAVGVTGATTLKSTGSTGTVTINNIAAPSADITIQSTAVNHTLDFANSAVTGTADAATVNVSGMTAGVLTVDTGIEVLNLVGSGGSANTIANADRCWCQHPEYLPAVRP